MEETSAQFFPSETSSAFPTIFSTIQALLNEVAEGRTVKPEGETPPGYKPHLLLYDVLIPLLGVIIILVNLAVVISSGLILKKGQQPRSTYMFLGNIALSDLVTGIAVLFGQFYPKQHRNHYICATQLGMIVSSTLASIYSVGLIAIDRYLFILHGLTYQTWVYPTRVRIFIIASWMIGCIIGYLPLMGWYGDTDNGRVCWFIFMAPKALILLTCVFGVIPILTVITLYSIILYRALKRIIQLQDTQEVNTDGLRAFHGRRITEEQKSSGPSKWKAIKVVMFTTGSFVCTWMPYFVASLMYAYCYDKDSKYCNTLRILIASPLAILGFMNSLINPIIYAWWHKGFRSFIRKKCQKIKMKRTLTREITASNTSKTTSTTNAHSESGNYDTKL